MIPRSSSPYVLARFRRPTHPLESARCGSLRFLGVRSDVPDLLQAMDVFALTSVCEAASLTLLEAMAAGLPVVVTAVGGNPEIVRDGGEGLLVPRGNDDIHGVWRQPEQHASEF